MIASARLVQAFRNRFDLAALAFLVYLDPDTQPNEILKLQYSAINQNSVVESVNMRPAIGPRNSKYCAVGPRNSMKRVYPFQLIEFQVCHPFLTMKRYMRRYDEAARSNCA